MVTVSQVQCHQQHQLALSIFSQLCLFTSMTAKKQNYYACMKLCNMVIFKITKQNMLFLNDGQQYKRMDKKKI